ncbi:response regulator [Phormidium yuhuli AB48]|uniref:Response regulator n=1 Tax=Phormidium yuhuli AB48 TaxID=2940671 RepID=A0ABY5ANI5_9CYAN|nr:response regulator [Phormidium yuhuli]USR90370.1 response regulator [Phormidium yuhuli AB48]
MTTRCILIIDDEEDIREVTQLTLELEGGWKVLAACSGSEGVNLARFHHPDAILLDVMMPEMDGLMTAKVLQEFPDTQPIPVLLLTAKGATEVMDKFQDIGITATISKPFDPLQLVPRIKQLLHWE